MTAALQSYQTVSVATADPGALVIQLFDGALRFLAHARRAAADGDGARFAYTVSRAHAITAELSNVLDRDAGGEVAANLDRLYDFLMRHLTEALVHRSGLHVDRVATILQTLRDAFDAARRA
ncbi:MAG TPA: flagellar export chaperone FliS [Terriglobales bacterium]|nr:flagellar export chaperone FliS [Terriglobales bacterium]